MAIRRGNLLKLHFSGVLKPRKDKSVLVGNEITGRWLCQNAEKLGRFRSDSKTPEKCNFDKFALNERRTPRRLRALESVRTVG